MGGNVNGYLKRFDIYPHGVYYGGGEKTMDKHCEIHGVRHKERTSAEQKELITRLNRIEGQLRGIHRMVEENTYCPDILIQVSAVNQALNSFNKTLLSSHIKSCVMEDVRAGKEEAVDELVRVLQKVMK